MTQKSQPKAVRNDVSRRIARERHEAFLKSISSTGCRHAVDTGLV